MIKIQNKMLILKIIKFRTQDMFLLVYWINEKECFYNKLMNYYLMMRALFSSTFNFPELLSLRKLG